MAASSTSTPSTRYTNTNLPYYRYRYRWLNAGVSEEPELSNFTFLSNASGDAYNYHRIELEDNGTALYAAIFPSNAVDVYYVYLKYDGFPNETYYDCLGVVPNPELDKTDPKRYVFAPAQNCTSINGTYRIGIRLKSTSRRISVASSFSSCRFSRHSC